MKTELFSRLRRATPVVLPVVILAAFVVENLPRTRTVTLTLNRPATSGRQTRSEAPAVAGTYVVNGVGHLYSGKLPATIEVRASRFSYSLWSEAGLSATLSVDGRTLGHSTTHDGQSAVHGETEFSGRLRTIKWTQIGTLPEAGFQWMLRVRKS